MTDIPAKWKPFTDLELKVMKEALEAAAPDVHSIMPLDAQRRVRMIKELDAVLTLREIMQQGERGE